MLWGYEEEKRWTNPAGVEVSEGVTYLNGEPFKSISGGGGKGPLPFGEYNLYPPMDITHNFKGWESYTRDGIGFFCSLAPKFETNRTLLGVHPDGKHWGTNGCDGLSEKIPEAYNACKGIPSEGVAFLACKKEEKVNA